MRPTRMICGSAILAAVVWTSTAAACGDKFLAPGRSPSTCALNKPPRKIAVLIYGSESSDAVSALGNADYQKTLKMVGYKVTRCNGTDECSRELKAQGFDVVLADAKLAGTVRDQTGSNVIPVLMGASKAEVKQAKAEYGQAFDAASGSLGLPSVINRAARSTRSSR